MLPRAVLRAANARYPARHAAILTSLPPTHFLRTYSSRNGRSGTSSNSSPYDNDIPKSPHDVSFKGPVRNTSFPPQRRASSKASGKNKGAEEAEYTTSQPEFDSPATAEGAGPKVSRQNGQSYSDPVKEKSEPSVSPQQPEFETVAGAQGGKDPNVEAAHPEAQQPAKGSTGPLPDLRHGIPSTFDQEFMDKLNKSHDAADAQERKADGIDLTSDPQSSGERPRGDREPARDEYVSSIDQRRNAMFKYMTIAGVAFGVVATLFMGRNWDTDEEARKFHDAPDGWSPGAVYKRLKTRIGDMFGYYTEPAFPKLLPTMEPGLMPPYTLVFSLENLLVSDGWSPKDGWQVAKRPGMDYFLRYLSQYYELVLFTSVYSMNADMVLRKLDPFQIITFPLFREATRYVKGDTVKDLSYLNRDLAKTIIIDTVPAHVRLQPENAIILPKWHGNINDAHANDLVALIPFLEYVATSGIKDVRTILKSYEGTHIPTEYAKREARAREAFSKRLAEERAKKGKLGSLAGGLSTALGFKPGNSLMQIPGEPSFADSLAAGKMPSDIIRERGTRNYMALDKEIRANGEKWLKEREELDKQAMEEAAKSMQGSVGGLFNVFGGGGSAGDQGKK